MTTAFEIAYKKTAVVEGGYANDPQDSGGETWRGISRNNFPDWPGWAIIDGHKKKIEFPHVLYGDAALQDFVLAFFKKNFWDRLNLDLIHNPQMRAELYDTAVNMGVKTSAKFLQTILNVTSSTPLTVDGNLGPKTADVLNKMSFGDQYIVWKLFNCLQGERYVNICLNNPSQKRFMRSWASRVFET